VSHEAPSRPRRWTRLQTIIVAVLVVVAAVMHVRFGLRNHFFDLTVYREAMQWWTGGHPLYEYSRPDETQGQLGFTYPPAGAFVLLPLAYMSSTVSLVAFIVVAVVCVAASVWWLVGPIAHRHSLPRTFVFAVAFLMVTGLVPVRLGFDFGQINPVLWALVVFDLAVLAPRHSRFLGVGIGLATAIKLFPGIFIVYLLLTGRRRGTVVAGATAALATLVAHVVAMKDSTTFWTERLLNGEGVGQLHYFMNQSLNGFLAREYLPGTPPKLLWLALVVPVFIYGMWRARRAGLAGDELTGIALTGFVGSLVSPLTWAHHIFWFAPAILAMVDTSTSPAPQLAAVRSGLRNRWALLAVSAFVYVTVTFNTLEYYEFSFHAPGGWLGIVMGDWYIWVMLALLALTPIDPARLTSGPDATTPGRAAAVRVGRHVAA
jgi:alpha-1,2-mannosyltransferase